MPCKSAEESAPSCLQGEVLCPVQSAASLSEFSSPEPCVYEYKPGFVPDDARHDILVADMSWAQAKAFCDGTTECSSFTFESANSRPTRPETVWFKRISYTDSSGKGWHTYIKKCPQPSTNRFSYLDELDRTALQWLEGELEDQLDYVRQLNMKAGGRSSDHDTKAHQTVMAEVLGLSKNGKNPVVTKVSNPEELAALMKRSQTENGGELKSDSEYIKSAKSLWNAVAATQAGVPEDLTVGVRVLARWKGGNFYSGKIAAKNSDGSVAVQFDDGDFDKRIPVHHVKLLDAGSEKQGRQATKSASVSSASEKSTKPESTVRQLVNMMERMLNNTLGGGK
eukprot:CAMPEP_0206253202 /NCGR_PEP_ID=MMETSP0047_2-20121206/23026_1 /ASSEMBLY_ACC=CAM_ASM_000192 /TAXON_ID=195065 /ORGANISM="Chroomonas mesostigmatica_cf, Strain CCMP1168" /LENGTH=337 /DNA_ID=CAMNT_0053679395 /DNA_START=142 /DNA_END=1155 /DNA_ORIENTATION=-